MVSKTCPRRLARTSDHLAPPSAFRCADRLDVRPTIIGACPADSDDEAHGEACADADEGAGVDTDGTFSLSEVIAKGFEASCVGRDRALYFWHRNFGVRVERRSGKATLLTDPSVLPDMRWTPTSTGARQLEMVDSNSLTR
jgi:hypothetical protein